LKEGICFGPGDMLWARGYALGHSYPTPYFLLATFLADKKIMFSEARIFARTRY